MKSLKPTIKEIAYYITKKDIQAVAEETIDRRLTKKEMEIAINNIGNHIDWYESIMSLISEMEEDAKNEKAKK